MIKPPRVACKYSLDATGPTLKSFLASQTPDGEHTWPQEKPKSSSDSLKPRGSEDFGRRPPTAWVQDVARGDCKERERDSAPETALSDQMNQSVLDRPGKESVTDRISGSAMPLPGHLIPVVRGRFFTTAA